MGSDHEIILTYVPPAAAYNSPVSPRADWTRSLRSWTPPGPSPDNWNTGNALDICEAVSQRKLTHVWLLACNDAAAHYL